MLTEIIGKRSPKAVARQRTSVRTALLPAVIVSKPQQSTKSTNRFIGPPRDRSLCSLHNDCRSVALFDTRIEFSYRLPKKRFIDAKSTYACNAKSPLRKVCHKIPGCEFPMEHARNLMCRASLVSNRLNGIESCRLQRWINLENHFDRNRNKKCQ